MCNFREKVIVGNLAIHAAIFRDYLKKSYYFLVYEPNTEIITLNGDHSEGAEVLFEIRNSSYENAIALAEKLGLNSADDEPLIWEKQIPVLQLCHNGSKEAESLRIEMLQLEVPHKVYNNAENFSLSDREHLYESSEYSVDEMLQIIQKNAKLCQS